jgi:hypothetical protein
MSATTRWLKSKIHSAIVHQIRWDQFNDLDVVEKIEVTAITSTTVQVKIWTKVGGPNYFTIRVSENY